MSNNKSEETMTKPKQSGYSEKAKTLGFRFYKEYICKTDKAKKYLIQLDNHKMFLIADRGYNQKDGYGHDIIVPRHFEVYKDEGIFIYDHAFESLSEAFNYLHKH